MSSTHIGKLNLCADESGLRVQLGGMETLLSPLEASRLEDFLSTFAPHERIICFRVPLVSMPAR